MTPTFHPKRLDEIGSLKKPSKIFVVSTGDLFGDWVPEEWILQVLKVVAQHPEHTFQFLTKNPKRYKDFYFTSNCWLGTTINSYKDQRRVSELRSVDFTYWGAAQQIKMFVSIEPLLEPLNGYMPLVDWIIVGADSNAGAAKPQNEWLDDIIQNARRLGLPVWVKDNYQYHTKIKEFPCQK
jgi:protein gp37